MARVRLYLLPNKSNQIFQFVRPGGIRDSIPALLMTRFLTLTKWQSDWNVAFQQAGRNCGAVELDETIIFSRTHAVNGTSN